ncbi:MAG TPA: hypothetical protein VEC11_08045 [Allosphingosinicella sp.]|nr:hypothetical protein [Allosphingosinicella sp.]
MTDSSSPVPPPEDPATPSDADEDDALFEPVLLRYRHDGWVPDKQLEFIQRLAECGCVDEACRAVGMSRDSAYALRRRPDAQAFRLAWAAAKDVMVERLDDAAMARAINGVPVPIFHNGEQIGERRHFDERLTMFLLRYRDPVRYGRWHDRLEEVSRHEDGPIGILSFRIARMLKAAWRQFNAALRGERMPDPEPEPVHRGRPDGDEDER